MGAIKKNSAKCLICGDTIESKNRDGKVTCSCGNIELKGGLYFLEKTIKDESKYEDLTEFYDLEKRDEYKELVQELSSLESFMGGDNQDTKIREIAIENMRVLLMQIFEKDLPLPEIFPWAGGEGLQFEWCNNWYVEVDSCGEDYSFFAIINDDDDSIVDKDNIQLEEVLELLEDYLNIL